MDKTNKTEQTMLKDIMESFIGSYFERDKSVNFTAWLAERLQEEVPNMPDDASEKLSAEIIEAVAAYDRTLGELNKNIEAGQSKESWLADRMVEAYSDLPLSDAGRRLQQFESNLNVSNTRLMQEVESTLKSEVTLVDDEVIDWNEYSLKSKALEVGKQAVMFALGIVASVVKRNVKSGENTGACNVVDQVIQESIKTASGEVKAVVAGAIKTAVENGLSDILPVDTPMGTICDIACAAVESADALMDVAMGKGTMVEALDKAGRAGVAAVCRFGADALKVELACIPVVGPVVVFFASGLLDHMKSPKFNENVYTVVHDTAVATWEGIKQASRGILNGLKNVVKQSLFN